MSYRSLIVTLLTFTLIPSMRVMAEDSIPPTVENSKYQFDGVINATSVYIRSGPGDGYYATQELSKGTKVRVVGITFEWLKIVPPAGSFSYVGKVFVDRHDNGSLGRINKDQVNTTVETRLNAGDEVKIIGEQDEYYKIEPPTGAYLYVNKQFVDMVAPVAVAATATTQPVNTKVATGTGNQGGIPDVDVLTTKAPLIDLNPATDPKATTQPALAAVTTQPVTPSADEQFAALEDKYAEVTKKPLEDQSLTDLITGYQAVDKADGLSDTLKHVADVRLATLKVRADSQAKLLEARRVEKDAAEKQLAMQAEQQELQERLNQTEVKIFAAVGTLQPSSLQTGNGGTLYRLTDPASGRTVVYIRTNDPKVANLTGQFVGVKGDSATDTQLSLRVITPNDVESVDPAKVNTTVAAEIVPPSLMARQASAN
jgi:uncharacterized protein YgiM (DUF1202 family)